MNENDRPLVLYHAHCPDGFCAAWIAWGRFHDRADYIPVNYGQPPPDVTNRYVYILDFSYKADITKELILKSRGMVILDHHQTAEEELRQIDSSIFQSKMFVEIRFDMEKSGARLAWEFFNFGLLAPWLVDYTEDRDLWRWALPNSKEINSALASYSWSFPFWDELILRDPTSLAAEGVAIERYKEQRIRSICDGAREINIHGYDVLAANTPILISEVAGALAKDIRRCLVRAQGWADSMVATISRWRH